MSILEQSKKSIDYFTYKTRFAINKDLHVRHLNTLVKVHNLLDDALHNPPYTLIEDLLAALYAELLWKFKNPHLAIAKLDKYLQYHHLNKNELADAVKDIIIQQPDILKNPEKTLRQLSAAKKIGLADLQEVINMNEATIYNYENR